MSETRIFQWGYDGQSFEQYERRESEEYLKATLALIFTFISSFFNFFVVNYRWSIVITSRREQLEVSGLS